MGQVFRNLLNNAVKFTLSGGTVVIDTGQEDHRVSVRIADSGIGIPAEDLPRLFDRFYRSELSVQQEIPGTGLGLATSREIVQRHQGTIKVESTVGQGSTFAVSLPML